jgi:FkbH-like protein
MNKKLLTQELLSGHTTLLLHENFSNSSKLKVKQKLLIVTNMAIEMYLPLIDNWLVHQEYFLDIKVVSTQDFISNKMKYLNEYRLRIIWVNSNSVMKSIKDSLAIENFDLYRGLTYFVNSKKNAIVSNLSNNAANYREVFVENRDIKDIYYSGLSNQAIADNCHTVFSVIERSFNPKYVKLLFIDLDNTIYKGEIAEGDKSNINFTENHIEFIDWLIDLAKSGVFIEIVSRNSPNVINELRNYSAFLELEKYITRFNFTLDRKSEVIRERLAFYNFLGDSIVFIDDNPAELFDVTRNNDLIRTFRILPDATNWKTLCLHIYLNPNENDNTTQQFRLADLDANLERTTLSEDLSLTELHSYLKTKISLKILDPVTDLALLNRCVSMSNRTNQFNISNRRISESDVFDLFKKSYDFITCALEDDFGDSGVIFFLVIKETGKTNAEIYELCISCRVLGRGLESILITEALNKWSHIRSRDLKSCKIDFIETSKNMAAKKWLQNVDFFENSELSVANLNILDEVRSLRKVVTINAS